MADFVATAFMAVGAIFFLAGTVGLLRFPDVYTRLHALTKADNLGLGLIVIGLSFLADSWLAVIKMVVIWILVLVASASVSHLVARSARQRGILPWQQ